MADHSEFVELAKELLAEEGTLVDLQELGTESRDSKKPWLGMAEENVVMEHRKVPCLYVPVIGKDLGIIVQDKEMLKRSQKVAIVAPFKEQMEDKITRIKDSDGTIWKVVWSQALRPAEQTIIYLFGVAR